MPFNWTPRKGNLYLPRRGALKDAINQSYQNQFGRSKGVIGSPEFEAPETNVFVQGGRAGIKGGDFLTDTLLPLPARALEAPFRPLVEATGGAGGAVGQALQGAIKAVPFLDMGLGILDGANRVSRSFQNKDMAQALGYSARMGPNESIQVKGVGEMTVRDLRLRALRTWPTNEITGEPQTIESLIARAEDNFLNFGEFRTDENAVVGFLEEAVTDPLNILGIGAVTTPVRQSSRAAIGAIGNWTRSAWAKPTVSLVANRTGLPRVGAGALRSLRGVNNVRSSSFNRATQWLDTHGDLGVGPARLGNVLDLAGKVYFPKYGYMTRPRYSQLTKAQRLIETPTGLGLNKVHAALASWELGGLTQMGVESGIEFAAGAISGRTYNEETGNVSKESASWVDDIQDISHAINNSHPLSENQTFVVLALFSPWMKALQARSKIGGNVSAARYFHDGSLQLSRKMGDLLGKKFKDDVDFLTQLGEGDLAVGKERMEILANQTDIMLVQNQFSDFVNAGLQTIEDKVQRATFLTNEVIDTVLRRRKSGALGGRSLADNIIRTYKEGWSPNPETRLMRAERTLTWDGFVRSIAALQDANGHMVNKGLNEMGNLQVIDGAPIPKETMLSLIGRMNKLDPDDLIPREVASFIIEDNPSLIYQDEWWREFSMTLGQMLEGTGRPGRDLLPTEGITVAQVKAQLEELVDTAPTSAELYHESLMVIERPRVTPDESAAVIRRPIPQEAPRVLKQISERVISRGSRLLELRKKVISIRNAEFFRSGKSRFESAQELTGYLGSIFSRRSENTFDKTVPAPALRPVKRTPEPYITTYDDAGNPLPRTYGDEPLVMKFRDKDQRTYELKATSAWEGTIGEYDVYVFKPTAGEAYRPNPSLGIGDNFEEVINPSLHAEGTYTIKDTDKWYVARKDGNGTFLTNDGFNTKKEATAKIHATSDAHVSVKIEDDVFGIEGRVPNPATTGVALRDTLDTEALDLAIQHGGRITEIDILPDAVQRAEINFDQIMQGEDDFDIGLQRFGIDSTELGTDYFEAFRDEAIFYYGQIDPTTGRGGPSILATLDKAGNPVKQEVLSRLEAIEILEKTLEPVKVEMGSVQHGDTLARRGFEEVARYGESAPIRVFKNYDSPPDTGFSGAYGYHFRPVTGLRKVKKNGLPLGISRGPREKQGVYFGVDAMEAMSLAPKGMTANSVLLRVKKDVINPESGRYGGEFVSQTPVAPEHIEYYGADDKWHPLTTTERAVFAYRGGDTTKATLTSRIEGATLPYKPTLRRTKTRAAALNIARRRSNQASLEYPMLETLGPGYTSGRPHFSPESRRAQLTELANDLQKQSVRYAEDIREVEDALSVVSGLNKVTDITHWWDKASVPEIHKMVDTVKELNSEWPALQIADMGGIYIDPRNERFGHLVVGYGGLARHVFDYGFLSPLSRFYDVAFTKRHSRSLQRDVYSELQVQTALVGMTPPQTTRFLEGVRQRVGESRSARGLGSLAGIHEARNIRALDESTLRVLIEEAAGTEVLDKILNRFSSVQKMVTESANGLLRKVASRERHGGKVSRFEANAAAAFRFYQYGPGIVGHASDATHKMSKFWYPLLRFRADPAFMMMNLIEPYMYGISRHGVRAMYGARTPAQKALNARATQRSSAHSIPAGGFADVENLPVETLLTDAGMWSVPRNMKGSIEAEGQIAREKGYLEQLSDIPDNDPFAIVLQERFGTTDKKTWAKGMDEVMYGWLNDGPEETVMTAFREMKEQYGWTDTDMTILMPWMNRFAEMHRAQYDNIADLYIGRLNRTGVERVMDNFWLMWPLSYTIKATKWLASIMFHRIGGINTGAGGAYMYAEYRERFMHAVENDRDMQDWLEENRDFIFLFEMMLPVSPESIGTSLNVPVRISGSWLNNMTLDSEELRNAIGDYSYIETVPEMVERSVRFGPIRSYNLFKRLMGQVEVPGFTFGSSTNENWMGDYSPKAP